MSDQGFDAVVAVSPENFAYIAGFVVPSQPLMRWRHAACVVTAKGQSALLAVDMEESTVKAKAQDAQIRIWGEFTECPMQALARLLSDLGLSSARIGIELDYLPAGDFATLKKYLPEAEFLMAETWLARHRQIKTPREIDLMRRLSRIADQAITNAFAGVSPGSTEMDIAGGLTNNIFSLGAEQFKLMIIATGERSVFPNVGPTARALAPQDICRVEIFPVINGYHAGVCRTAQVLTPPPHAEEIWRNLIECKYLILDMIKPGASSRGVYEAFIGHLAKLNLPPIQFVGHGIGLHLHEEPYLGMYSDTPLEAGMVLGIEPLVYDTGYGFGMQNKDIVVVTESGCELLSDFTNTDHLLTVS